MANPVGDGDLGNLWFHVEHLLSDLAARDFAHAWVHVWPILDEIRRAAANLPPATFAAGVADCPAITPGAACDDARHAACMAAAQPLADMLALSRAVGSMQASALDWRSLLQFLLQVLPFLL
jgi:hypothetical protein